MVLSMTLRYRMTAVLPTSPAPRDPAAPDMRRQRLDGAARHLGARGEAAAGDQPVVHQDGAGDSEIDAELHRDLHRVIAAGDEFGRQRSAFGTEDVGGPVRMGEARQFGRIVERSEEHTSELQSLMRIS